MYGLKEIKNIFMLLLMTSILMIGCTYKEDTNILKKVKGVGFTYNEYFKMVDELDSRSNGTYYKPLTPDEMITVIPDSLKNAVNMIDTNQIPFDVNEKAAYLVTSKDEKGHLKNQVQFSYLNNSSYLSPVEFLIISVTEVDENPLEKYDFSKGKYDTVGNELRKEVLINDVPIFHQVITSNRALVYTYYRYNEKEEHVAPVATAANELYGYYNGHVYHIGYLIEGNKYNEVVQDKILQLTREFIIGE